MPELRFPGFWNLGVTVAIAIVTLQFVAGKPAPASSPVVFVEADTASPPSPSDLPKSASEDTSSRARLVFAGDIMQHAAQASDDFDASYAKVAPFLRAADLAVGNLEFPVVPDIPVGPPADSVQFNGTPAHLDALSRAGFTLFSTSNNHAFDQGVEGIRSTIAEVESRGIGVVGTAPSRTALERSLVMRDVHGIRIAFFAYTGTLNIYLDDKTQYVDPPADLPIFFANFSEWDAEYRERAISLFRDHVARARAAGADFVVALTHWGEEWTFGPSSDQRAAARDLVDVGFDLVVGGHSHVLNSAELYRGKLIVYSLGNFVCDFVEWQARTGALLDVVVVKDVQGATRVSDFLFHPLLIHRKGHLVEPLDASAAHAEGETRLSWDLARKTLGEKSILQDLSLSYRR